MSYVLHTMCVPLDRATFQSGEPHEHAFVSEQLNRGAKAGEMLYAPSRKGFLDHVMSLMGAHYGLDALSFMYRKPWGRAGAMNGVFLEPEALDRVIQSIDDLFSRIEADPTDFLTLDPRSTLVSNETELLLELRSATSSLKPMHDDGDTLDCVFNFLWSLQAMCKSARESGSYVMFTQFSDG
jgi:hypothetical protein